MIAETRALTGMVLIQAQTIRPATPQRTAERRRSAEPTPTIAPVITCVVETGTPRKIASESAVEPAISAQKPPTGLSLVIFIPIVLTIRQPPLSVPRPIAP